MKPASSCRPLPRGILLVACLMFGDLVVLSASLLLALGMRFDELSPRDIVLMYLSPESVVLPIAFAGYLILFALFNLYRTAWRFASLEVLSGVVWASSLGLGWFLATQEFFGGTPHLPRSVMLIFWLLTILMVGGVRLLLRIANPRLLLSFCLPPAFRRRTGETRAVILGADTQGVYVLTALEQAQQEYHIVGFLDDRPDLQGLRLRGIPVLGPLAHLNTLLEQGAVDEVLVASNEQDNQALKDCVIACRRKKIPVKVIPDLQDVLKKSVRLRLEEISVEDLLRRPPVHMDASELGQCLTGRRVLVTGAGGSIGSEICRQVLALQPSSLVLFGHGENSLYLIQQELLRTAPQMKHRIHVVVGSVADDTRVEQVMNTHRPEVVFHAAAHKHVPMMEVNVCEAVQNNVMGTRVLATACGRAHVERMVLISTDKAVKSSSVMGATKWLCEEVLQVAAQHYPDTAYITVRFGNVLGSRGSVVPIFKEQIRRGGPVTITHQEMTRYFMTIPEAVQLVLQAGSIGSSREVYLLDMGSPVRIVDLAKDMIWLCGLEPDKDINIVFTGLRPGEKLHEELTNEEETALPSARERLFVVQRPMHFAPTELRDFLREMQHHASQGDEEDILSLLASTVPGFAERNTVPQKVSAATEPTAPVPAT